MEFIYFPNEMVNYFSFENEKEKTIDFVVLDKLSAASNSNITKLVELVCFLER